MEGLWAVDLMDMEQRLVQMAGQSIPLMVTDMAALVLTAGQEEIQSSGVSLDLMAGLFTTTETEMDTPLAQMEDLSEPAQEANRMHLTGSQVAMEADMDLAAGTASPTTNTATVVLVAGAIAGATSTATVQTAVGGTEMIAGGLPAALTEGERAPAVQNRTMSPQDLAPRRGPLATSTIQMAVEKDPMTTVGLLMAGARAETACMVPTAEDQAAVVRETGSAVPTMLTLKADPLIVTETQLETPTTTERVPTAAGPTPGRTCTTARPARAAEAARAPSAAGRDQGRICSTGAETQTASPRSI